METTYGDRLHRPFDESLNEFYHAVNSALSRGGNVVIPTFALERAQEMLFFLRQGVAENRLPPSLPVYLDSPMAISATQIFERHRDDFTPEVQELFDEGTGSFQPSRTSLHPREGRFHRDQQRQERRDHHGRIGHGHGRPDSPSSDP